jgi:FHS family glucose/mannose:H+ symporter-like MFS transporter
MGETQVSAKHKAQQLLLISVAYATTAMLGIYITVYQYTILTISQGFLVGAAIMGLMIAMQHFGMSVPPLLIGAISARIGKKRLMLASYSLIIIGALLVGLLQSLAAFIVSVFIIGAGFSVTEATVSAVLSDEFPEASRRHLSFSQVFFSVGALAGPLIAEGLITLGASYKHLFVYCAGAFLLLAVLLLFTKHQNDKGVAAVARNNPFKLLGSRVFLFLALGVCLYVGIENTIANFTDSYYELELGVPAISALALSLYWGAMIPSRFLAGLIKGDIKKVFIALSALVVAAVLAAMLIPDHTVKLVCFALAGFGCGPLWPLMMDSAAQRYKGASGSALGVMMAFSGLGGAVLPLVAGVFVNFSAQQAAYYISAAAVVMMVFVYLLSLKKSNISG